MHRLRSRPALLVLGGIILLMVLAAGAVVVLGSPEPTPAPSPTPTVRPTPTPTPSPSPSPTPTPSPSPSPTPTPEAVCPMNGQPLADRSLANRTPIVAQVENNPIARPPSGLNLADLVIEAPVEGDTTRFMAVYMCQPTVGANVGPIRSARYFNIDLFEQLRSVTFHFGGGGKVISRFDREGVPYVNGLSSSWGFFSRGGPWAAPHNVYLDVDAARNQLEDGGLAALADIAGRGRAPFNWDPGVELPQGRDVNAIGLQTASFWRFGWQWDGGSGRWLRTDAGAPNTDRLSGDRISARTVIVQVVRQEVLHGELDPGGYPRRYQFLTGSGEGVLYIDGQAHDVQWSRPSPGYMTNWTYEATGEPVILPPGKVWWEIIPRGSAISEG